MVQPLHAAFVAPFLLPATLRFVEGAAALDRVGLSLITQEPLERVPPSLRVRLVGHWRIDDALDDGQIVAAAQGLSRLHGRVDRLIGSLEQLQVPLATASQRLGLPGLDPQVARRYRDKHAMKAAFAAAGVPCARNALVHDAAAARDAVVQLGLPIVVKPPAGAGAKQTFRVDSAAQLDAWLAHDPPHPQRPALLEEFLRGEEFSFDCVSVDGRIVWRSICAYRPSPLTVLENPWIQWCVLLPRELDDAAFAPIHVEGARALAALGAVTAMTHMEWFRRPDGSVAISEVAARPPGAQFTTLISHAHATDFYRAWPRLMISAEFAAAPRRFAAGAAYLRGLGEGRVARIDGRARLQQEFGTSIVEARWPAIGERQPDGYEGAGFVVFRNSATAVVETALQRTLELVRIHLG